MAEIFLLLFFITFICLIVGLVKPSFFTRIIKKEVSRRRIGLILGSTAFIFFILIGITAPKIEQVKPDELKVAGASDKQAEQKNSESVASNQLPTKKVTQDKDTNNPVETKTVSITEKASTIVNPTPAQATPQYTYYSVVSVVDGDTLKININGTTTTLRLIGIDTPETVDPRKTVQCFGKEASNKAKELLSGKKVRIEKDSTQGELDKYGRLLAYIYREDGLFYNKYMIEQGYAHEYTYNLPYKYQAEFKAAEKSARENQLGLWSPNTCSGNTTNAASVTTTTQTQTQANTNQASGKYYTSSYASSKYYYPAACPAWQSLSSGYLKAFDSLQALLVVYPSRILSPQCSQ